MRHWLAALVVALATPPLPATDLVLPGAPPQRVRLELRDGAGDPEAAWETFLDRFFAFHDRDGDAVLAQAEGARVFALPLPGRREVKLDFAAADADRDGRLSRAEFKEFYRRAGFTPVVVHVVPPTAEEARLAETLFRALDRDGDGKITAAELGRAAALLDRFDFNEDEAITPDELLLGAAAAPPAETATVTVGRPDREPAVLVRLDLSRDKQQALFATPRDKSVTELQAGGKQEVRFRLAGSVCAVGVLGGDTAKRFEATRQFYLASFDAACSGKASVEKKQLVQDVGWQVLVGLFDPADRDGDGKLTRSELVAFLALIELGVQCQVVVTITDRERNLFEVFDADRDGRLDWRELRQGAKRLADLADARDAWARADIPRQYQIAAGRGTAGNSFGPAPLVGTAKRPAEAPAQSPRGPRWFRAQDRNGDGALSPGEFVGPPDLFRRLDVNGDGLIDADEAERHEKQPR